MKHDMAHSQRASERAHQLLREEISLVRASAREHIGPIAHLAAKAGVSRVTMWKAVQQLRARQVLTIGHNRRIMVAANAPEPVRSSASQSSPGPCALKWQRLMKRMYTDIREGRFAAGETLPPIKQLLGIYGVSYPTLRKALDSLIGNSILISRKTRLIVPAYTPRDSRRTIVVIKRSLPSNDYLYGRYENIMRILQQFVSKERLNVEVISYQVRGRQVTCSAGTLYPEFRDRADIAGVVVWALTLASYIDLDRLCEKIIAKQLPVAILDESGTTPPFIQKGDRRLLRFFTYSFSPRCGLLTGRYLLQHNIVSAAFIGLPRLRWSANRYAGLRQAFIDAGLPAPPACELADFDKGTDDEFVRIVDTLRKQFRRIPEFLEPFDQRYVMLKEEYRSNVQAGKSIPVFMRMLSEHPHCTCWVTANDSVALMVRKFFNSVRKHSPPHLVSFDDSLEAFADNITSFNFNLPGIVSAILSHLLYPYAPRPDSPNETVVEIDGWVVAR